MADNNMGHSLPPNEWPRRQLNRLVADLVISRRHESGVPLRREALASNHRA
jgi:hypothetical protein